MSTISAYHDPEGPQPEERDPEEMAPDEERMLEMVAGLRLMLNDALRTRHPLVARHTNLDLDQLDAYFQQAIAQRNGGCTACGMHWEACCCPVVDPFSDEVA